MKKLALLISIISIALLGCQGGGSTKPSSKVETTAKNIVSQIAAGSYSDACSTFDDKMAGALPADRLETFWKGIQKKQGTFQKIVGTRIEKKKKYDVVYVTCQFEKSEYDVMLAFDSEMKVGGLRFVATKKPAMKEGPSYADAATFTESEITVTTGKWEMPGTLTMPNGDGPFPAVVLVHGSGPSDRDETIGPNKVFRDLAWGLATKGIAVIRYEKRTFACKDKLSKNDVKTMTLKDETIDDAVSAVEILKSTDKINARKIIVVGHSLGAFAAPKIAETSKDVAGIVLLAGNASAFENIYLEQVKYLAAIDGYTDVNEKKAIAEIEAQIALLNSDKFSENTMASLLPMSLSPLYWKYLKAYNPVKTASELSVPVFVLQGARDYQVTVGEISIWKKGLSAKGNASFKLYETLNHLFITGSGQSSPDEYATPGYVAEDVVTDIAKWMKK